MRWFSKAVIAAAFLGLSGAALAQDLIPERRVVVTQDQDLSLIHISEPTRPY